VYGSLPAFDSKNGLRLVAGQGALLALGRKGSELSYGETAVGVEQFDE
jgi:hypothetical protein